jgi:hypothetical protein
MSLTGIRSLVLRAVPTLLLMASTSANANCGGSLDQAYCSDVHIVLLFIEANQHAYITINGNVSALPCTAPSGFLKLPKESTNYRAVYATLLSAHLASRPLNVRLAPIASECTITYVSLP